ncbi:MAG: MFS transporter [Anaerolineaceae bacterium]|nr:MFS transporter [Anaerolineaceae bacterium]
MKKEKNAYPLDFKTMFGVTTMGLAQMIANSLITGFLMLYITDYSGIYAGIAGKAAQVATLMLLIGRVWDGINDPLLGYVMDRSPRTKHGKFKPFMFWATLGSSLLIIALFNIPAGLSDLLKVAWIYVLYILFDTAFTLLPMNPLIQSLSNDAVVRTKLLVTPRLVTTALSILMSFFLAIAIALGGDGVTPNIGLAVIVFMVPFTAISMAGVAMIKEGENNADEEQVKFKDVLLMAKANKPLWISQLSGLFGGFIFSFLMAAVIYYIKYAFGAENLGTYSMIWGLVMLFGMVLGTILAQIVQKRVTPAVNAIISNLITIIPLILLFLINLAGPIRNPYILFPLILITVIGSGMSYIPGTLIGMECMDFNKFKLGKSLEGMVNSVGQFTMKLQAAISSAITGVVLAAVGYDAVLYQDATTIPASLFSGLGLVLFGIPALCGLIASGIMVFYPYLKREKRDAMYAEIESAKSVM